MQKAVSGAQPQHDELDQTLVRGYASSSRQTTVGAPIIAVKKQAQNAQSGLESFERSSVAHRMANLRLSHAHTSVSKSASASRCSSCCRRTAARLVAGALLLIASTALILLPTHTLTAASALSLATNVRSTLIGMSANALLSQTNTLQRCSLRNDRQGVVACAGAQMAIEERSDARSVVRAHCGVQFIALDF